MSGEEDSVKDNRSMRKSLKRKKVSSTTINFIDQLPEALLVEILIRLPCKPCFKCKSVSKRWLSIISQPCFVREFIRLRKMMMATGTGGQPSLSLLKQNNYVDQAKYLTTKWEWNEKAYEFPFTLVSTLGPVLDTDRIFETSGFSLDFLPACQQQPAKAGRGFLSVVGSSRDLLLCSSPRRSPKDYYVCNPLTKQWIQLPQPPNVFQSVVIGFFSEPFIRFDDDEQAGAMVVDLNFEFRYKVIRMKRWQSNSSVVEIFSSETGVWSESFVTLTQLPDMSWFCFHQLTPGVANCGTVVRWWWMNSVGFTVYDPSQNCIRLIAKPNNVPFSGKMCDIRSCRGSIRISHLLMDPDDENDNAPHFEIWELEEYSVPPDKWRLVRSVDARELRGDDTWLQQEEISPMIPDLLDIFIHPDDGDLVYLVFPQTIGLCNMRAMTLTSLGMFNTILSCCLLPLQLQHWPTPLSHRGRPTRLPPQGDSLTSKY